VQLGMILRIKQHIITGVLTTRFSKKLPWTNSIHGLAKIRKPAVTETVGLLIIVF
jgi:hypothetical protein